MTTTLATSQTGPAGSEPVEASAWKQRLQAGLRDLRGGIGRSELWLFLGWRDVRKHYSRSKLGPLWLTLSMGVLVASLGLLYSQIFKMEITTYLPYLTVGFIVWNLISGIIIGACYSVSGAAGFIRQMHMPASVYMLKFVWSQLITFGHNALIYVVVAVLFGIWPGLTGLLALPALALLTINGVFICMILGPLCARFRDVPMVVASLVQIAFFLTPIVWSAEQLPERAILVSANPFYHFIEIIRDPLLAQPIELSNWLACLAITVVHGGVALLFFSRFRSRIAYWA